MAVAEARRGHVAAAGAVGEAGLDPGHLAPWAARRSRAGRSSGCWRGRGLPPLIGNGTAAERRRGDRRDPRVRRGRRARAPPGRRRTSWLPRVLQARRARRSGCRSSPSSAARRVHPPHERRRRVPASCSASATAASLPETMISPRKSPRSGTCSPGLQHPDPRALDARRLGADRRPLSSGRGARRSSSAVIIFVRLAIGSSAAGRRAHSTSPLSTSNRSPAAGGCFSRGCDREGRRGRLHSRTAHSPADCSAPRSQGVDRPRRRRARLSASSEPGGCGRLSLGRPSAGAASDAGRSRVARRRPLGPERERPPACQREGDATSAIALDAPTHPAAGCGSRRSGRRRSSRRSAGEISR